MIETQLAQQASLSSRPQGTLPGKPDINPREHVNAVAVRYGKEHHMMPDEEEHEPIEIQNALTPLNETKPELEKVKQAETGKYIPSFKFVPFPQRLLKYKLDKKVDNSADQKNESSIVIPITEVVPPIEDSKSVVSNEKCNTIFSSNLPTKLKDPGSFSIPC
jgi:hypothetical protein